MGSAGDPWAKRRWRAALRTDCKEVEVVVRSCLKRSTAVPLIGRNVERSAITGLRDAVGRRRWSSSWGRRRRFGAAQRDEAAPEAGGRQAEAGRGGGRHEEAEWS